MNSSRVDSNGIEQAFELFPGFDNLTDTNGDGFGDKVVDSVLNNGKPDAFVRASADGEYIDYQFSADNLAQFNGFRIKIVMSGTNEAEHRGLETLELSLLHDEKSERSQAPVSYRYGCYCQY